MDPTTELRRVPRHHLLELIAILEYMESWKRLMSIIPKQLKKDTFECPLEVTNRRKYNTDQFKRIESASERYHRACTDLLFENWGTSGRVRPTIGHLLYLLTKAELFRAADYVAIQMLHLEQPDRPKDGPAAPITTTLPDIPSIDSSKMDQLLYSLDSQPIAQVERRISNETIRNNMDHSSSRSHEHVVPEILISEAPVFDVNEEQVFHVPLVIQNPQGSRRNSSSRNSTVGNESTSNNVTSGVEVSDMIKFSQTVTPAEHDYMPQLSSLLKQQSSTGSVNGIWRGQSSTSNHISSQNGNTQDGTCTESDGLYLPPISNLLVSQTSNSEVGVPDSSPYLPNLSGLNLGEAAGTSDQPQTPKIVLYPNMSESINSGGAQDGAQTPQILLYPNMTQSDVAPLPNISLLNAASSSSSRYSSSEETQSCYSSSNSNTSNSESRGAIEESHLQSAGPNIPNLSALYVQTESEESPPQSDLIPNISGLLSNATILPLTLETHHANSDTSTQTTHPHRKSYNPHTLLQINTQIASKASSASSGTSHLSPSILTSGMSHLSSQNSRLSPTASQNSSRPSCHSPLPNLTLNTSLPHYTYTEIEASTNNFDESPHVAGVVNSLVDACGRFLGKGAFGSVYLALGLMEKPIAVKKLFLNNVYIVNVDDAVTKQFKNEVEILSKYKHESLLSLVGYSCDGPTYCLLYEYISGGALNDRLLNYENKLLWKERVDVAARTAEAVSYLHTAFETPLVHRDIKSANILLDCRNKPKLCDFGLIKLTSNSGTTNFNTEVFGTSAYMAPEAFRGDISDKLDTFSFGVVLLELLTSLPPIDNCREGVDLVTHVQDICDNDIDPLLDTAAGDWCAHDVNFASALFQIGNRCLEEKKNRPKMVDVAKQLKELDEKCPKTVTL